MAEAATKLPVKTEKSTAPAPAGNWTGPFESLRREIDRLFDDFHPFDFRLPSTRSLFGRELPALRNADWLVAPAMDLVEKDKEYEITVELPGIDEKNVEIKLANRILTLKGEKKEEKEEKDNDYYLSERRYGSFQRSFQLPEGVDADKIDATFAKGVLTVKLPKTAEAQKAEKKITVKAA
ncbi:MULTISPECIES: Hsp20/alpha crystallin family protein [unclassified Mesorhizobium]|uniref:Hsp20/alpha crystallin family protein n=1 Tax=unclassified Mesorhizobium TaxID=325217 RepID=UPI000FCB0DA8|nr:MULTISPECIES: Hsp20/alpha crystallin family protein [unclassified Mesorhizobium]RUW27761.1 Hsp20/alpha crystallin family protein [Mesorhizobium sp. M4B.F.Ca.ET.013.02.1.1]RUW73774.1 Hsp20/alpha crystallin family protein [Mesorhizobium sp. M4B.F.Ca.ET.049.02.1.2]RVD31700.1 Hsp20/alpha crystallin family protein [Mesorhizobium sp. M4B.F.Ca.ET.017.02.2.1]RVD46679.1 Hsp20/alpha crystallin family protein [Mesorhizobium sp. M4B.F.Ca.ET.019.03.1.1]RWF67772.1 MAG: Hsp20/alpha crystallin family prote